MTTDTSKNIIDGISDAIAVAKVSLDNEYRHPGYGADESDDKIKALRTKIKALRECRERLEIVFYGEGEA